MFKYFLSRNKSLLKNRPFVFPRFNAADIFPVISSYLTNCCPVLGRVITHGFVSSVYGNQILLKSAYKKQLNKISLNHNGKPVLVISDLNIGDAINLQVACQTLKQIFPERAVYYVVNKKAHSLIEPNPYIDKVFPIFSGEPVPNEQDVENLKNLVAKSASSLIFNFCPFFEKETFGNSYSQVLNHYPLTIGIAYDELKTKNVNHLRKKIFSYLITLFPDEVAKNEVRFIDARIAFNADSINQAKAFLKKNGLQDKKGLILFNSDATSRYTKLPVSMQIALINELINLGAEHVLISSGFVFSGVEKEILEGVGPFHAKKCVVVPKEFSLNTFAALIDMCDVFITNDTGPMHLAASWKWDTEGNFLRNRTAIFSVFGATPARIYSYDSKNPLFFPAPQNAPSRVFISNSNCRNITCINKRSKRCASVRCFDGLEPKAMAGEIMDYLKSKVWD